MFGIKDLSDGEVIESNVTIPDLFMRRQENRTIFVAVPKDYINKWQSGHKCEHEGCFKDGSVECHVPAEKDIELIEHLCQDHAYEAGYCSLCGSFWGGVESFDFNNPQQLCENCLDQLKTELGEAEIEEAEYYVDEDLTCDDL